MIKIQGGLAHKTNIRAVSSKASSSYFGSSVSFTSIFTLSLSLRASINEKSKEVLVAIEVGLSFKLDGNEVDGADSGLKIGEYAAIRFCFTSASFSRFFSPWFFKVSFVD